MTRQRNKVRPTRWDKDVAFAVRAAVEGTPAVQLDGVAFPHPDFVMQSGRYAGSRIRNLPDSYLEWGLEQGWDWAADELTRRFEAGCSTTKGGRR